MLKSKYLRAAYIHSQRSCQLSIVGWEALDLMEPKSNQKLPERWRGSLPTISLCARRISSSSPPTRTLTLVNAQVGIIAPRAKTRASLTACGLPETNALILIPSFCHKITLQNVMNEIGLWGPLYNLVSGDRYKISSVRQIVWTEAVQKKQ